MEPPDPLDLRDVLDGAPQHVFDQYLRELVAAGANPVWILAELPVSERQLRDAADQVHAA